MLIVNPLLPTKRNDAGTAGTDRPVKSCCCSKVSILRPVAPSAWAHWEAAARIHLVAITALTTLF